MAITTLAQSGYVPWGLRKIMIHPAIADMSDPTLTEIGTGTDITPQLTAYAGFTQQGNTVDSQSFVGPPLKLGVAPTLPDSSVTTRASQTSGDDIRAVLDEGDETYIGIYTEGTASDGGTTFDLFKVKVNSMEKSTDPNEAATITTTFALTAPPQFNVTIPTS